MASEKGSRKVKNQNIQVFVRVRPHTKRELELRPCTVIEVVNNREVVVQQTQHIKNFTFDRAFGPQAKQVEIYQEVVSPLIEEVLRGYNCTVLGYGQTGTGKTHTMVGESPGNNDTISNDSLAGIIPRALSQLFDELRASNTKHSVRVSFLELYNEELTDLLAPGGDNSKLRIYEDVTRKGTNIINGLKEITVSNKNEVYKIMAQGQERKRVAATLLNAQSRNPPKCIFERNTFFRSHTVFTIVVHMCENSSEGEELVKIGKLNLVDLAGSENISKAGSDNPGKRERARECANINQSLLTLSRVITALVARHPHVPYRESKLTRILQESLGGRTKTSLIATISPDHKDLEETISTLEYAHRAKNIQNQPEINQKMCEKVIVKEYLEVIDRLQRELQAAKNEMDTYDGITTEREELNNEIQELMLQKKSVEEKKDKVETMFRELNRTLEQKDCDLNLTKNKLSVVEDKLAKTTNMLVSSKLECSQQKHLVQAVSGTERELREQAQCILSAADVAALHVRCLHDTVDKRRNVESQNLQVTRSYREQASQLRSDMAADSKHFTATTVEELKELHTALQDFATITTTDLEAIKSKLEGLLQKKLETMDEVKKLTDLSHNKLVSGTESQRARVVAYVAGNDSAVKSAVHTLLCRAVTPLQIAQTRDVPENVAKFVQQWEQGTVAHVTSLCHVQQSFVARMQESTNSQIQTAYVQRNNIKTRKDLKDRLVQAWNQEVKEEKIALKKRYIEQLGDIEAERRNCQSRLEAWVEKERSAFERKRAAFEERLNNHVETEMAAIEQRLSKRLKDIEQDHCNQEARMASRLSLQEKTRQINAEEMQEMMQELQHWETARNDNSDTVKCYVKDFDEGTSAISTVTELYSSKVVEVLDHIYQEFIKAMQLSNQQTQEEAQALVSQVQSAGALFVENTSCALEDAVATNKKLGQEMMESIQTKTSTSSDSLKEVSASLGTLVSSTAASHSAHETSVLEITALLNQFEDNLNNAVTNLEEVQGRFLNEEYKVYSPIGKTPARCEIRYPRDLPTSSPHERILARFPNIQDYSPVQDSEVVESGSESRVNRNCESEDLTSLQPSPTPGPSILTQRHPSQPIVQKLRLSHDRQVHFED